MGINFILMMGQLFGNEQVKTALYLTRPAAEVQIQQMQYIEKKQANMEKIIEAIEGMKK